MNRARLRAGGALLGLAVIAGCSQVAQLQPVAGDDVTSVRIATNDVLLNEGIPVLVAPVCAIDGADYRCTGSTQAGEEIVAVAVTKAEFGATKDQWGAPAPAVIELKITVGGEPLFSGTVQGVLERNGQVTR